MPKRSLRQALLAQRRQLSAAQVRTMSVDAQERLLALPVFSQSTTIALYAATHQEVETGMLRQEADRAGKMVFFPAVTKDGLQFRRLLPGESLISGPFGIGEPPSGAMVLTPAELELIVVPGVAFDPQGRRIGYGKGFYDRALHGLEGSGRLWGLCFDFQVLSAIAEFPHDVRVHGIVTEHRVLGPCD